MYIDIFIVIVLIFALVRGLMNGFFKELASTIGLLVGLLLAALCYETCGEYLAVDGSEVNQLTSIIAFLLLWIVVPMVFGMLAMVLTKAINSTILETPNRIAGGILSMAKYVVLLSCVFNVMTEMRILDMERAKGSVLAPPVQSITEFAIEKAPEYAPKLQELADTIYINRELPLKVDE